MSQTQILSLDLTLPSRNPPRPAASHLCRSCPPRPFPVAACQVAFQALDKVEPITHAIANVGKRVFVIGFSILALGNAISTQTAIGSAVAIFGAGLYRRVDKWMRADVRVARDVFWVERAILSPHLDVTLRNSSLSFSFFLLNSVVKAADQEKQKKAAKAA